MSSGKKLVTHWAKFIKDNMNIVNRGGPTLGKERSYKNVAITKEFERVDAERKRRRMKIITNQKQSRVKLLENQVRLIDATDQFKQDLEKSTDIDSDTRSIATEFLENMDPKQKKKMIKLRDIARTSGINSFEEYKRLSLVQDSGMSELIDKSIIKSQNKEEISDAVIDLESQIVEINQELLKYEDLEKESDELSATHMILTGLRKGIIQNFVHYYETRVKLDHGFTIHPESMEVQEKISYALDHNLPVRRDYIYRLAPECFTYEIGEMKRLMHGKFEIKPIEFINEEQGHQAIWHPNSNKYAEIREKNKAPIYQLLEDTMEEEGAMTDFIENKSFAFLGEYEDYFESKFEEGWQEYDDVITSVEMKDVSLRSDLEADLFKEVIVIRTMNRDLDDLLQLNRIRLDNAKWMFKHPEYITRNPVLLQYVRKQEEYILKYAHDFSVSMFAPPTEEEMGLEGQSNEMENTIEKYKKDKVQQLIDQSNEEYKKATIGGDLIKVVPRDEKDPRQIERLNVMGEIINIIDDEKQAKKNNVEVKKMTTVYGSTLFLNKPQEGKMLLRELTKVLFLNNVDPTKYNQTFWAAYFNIKPQVQLNLFNFVSYPIVEGDQIIKILRFINFEE